ncbi:MAG: type II toxin-antitoxin system HicB family antitoxin [Candidatus Paceibacteria bacterium]
MKKRKETIFKYETIFDPNGEGYTITVPKLPGLVTEGNTLGEARAMARDAIRCYLGAILKDKMRISKSKIIKKEILAVSI